MRREAGAGPLLRTLFRAAVLPARPRFLVLSWRWRYETALLVGLLAGLVVLAHVLTVPWTLVVVTAVTVLLTSRPAARRRLVARAWCILTPHRFRAGCTQAGIHSRRGWLPAILWCAPRSYGEQLLVWCPAGVIAEDFVVARQILAAACYASDIEVVADPKYRHLVMLAVSRYQASSVAPQSSEHQSSDHQSSDQQR